MASPQHTPQTDSFTFVEHLHAAPLHDQRSSDLPESISTYENAETYDRAYRYSSNKDRSTVPSVRESDGGWYERKQAFSDVPSPGYEPHGSPYLYQPPEKRWFQMKEQWLSRSSLPSTQWAVEDTQERQKSRGQRKSCWIWLVMVILIIIIIGLGLGIGLWQGLKKHSSNAISSSNSELLIGGALDPAYYSTTGAFNGSGIAMATASFAAEGTTALFFQHHTGSIRYMLLDGEKWIGGTTSEIVASNARNGTPIAAVPYNNNGKAFVHVFYLDADNRIRERYKTNETNSFWSKGMIDKSGLVANDADQVGLQAVWSSSYPDGVFQGGMTLWYASDDTTFKQYGWNYGDDSWTAQGEFNDLNGHAGVGCYTWAPESSVMYAMFVNTNNAVEFYWKDTNSSLKSTDSHPIDQWTKVQSMKIPNVYPATSLGYTTYFYAQMDDNLKFNGHEISFDAENTKIVNSFIVDGEPGIAGTHLSVTGVKDEGRGNSVDVFYQVEGDDITQYVRPKMGGLWTGTELTIPNN